MPRRRFDAVKKPKTLLGRGQAIACRHPFRFECCRRDKVIDPLGQRIEPFGLEDSAQRQVDASAIAHARQQTREHQGVPAALKEIFFAIGRWATAKLTPNVG